MSFPHFKKISSILTYFSLHPTLSLISFLSINLYIFLSSFIPSYLRQFLIFSLSFLTYVPFHSIITIFFHSFTYQIQNRIPLTYYSFYPNSIILSLFSPHILSFNIHSSLIYSSALYSLKFIHFFPHFFLSISP